MHLKPISRELRRELYGRKRRGRRFDAHLSSPYSELSSLINLCSFVDLHSASRERGGGRPKSRERQRSRDRSDRRGGDRSGRY